MSVLPQDETGKAEYGYDYDFGMPNTAIWVDDGAGGVELWDGNVELLGDVYLSVDELEDLLQTAPVDRTNASYDLSWTNCKLTQIDMTVESVTYRRTLTYTGNQITGIGAWVTL